MIDSAMMKTPSPAYWSAGLAPLIAHRFANQLAPMKSTKTTIHPLPPTSEGPSRSAIPELNSRVSMSAKIRIAPNRWTYVLLMKLNRSSAPA